MIKVIVIGACGRMGRTVCDAVSNEDDLLLAAPVDTALADDEARDSFGGDGVRLFASLEDCLAETDADVAVEFTTPATAFDNVMTCLASGVHCVVGTTGMGEEQLAAIAEKTEGSDANCFLAPNFAIGAVLLMEAAVKIARHLPRCEIIEEHHDRKLDAPSGTALRTAELIAAALDDTPQPAGPSGHGARGLVHEGIPIHSVRLPGIVANQEVIFGGEGQTLRIRHDSLTRESFMPGVILAVRRVGAIDGMVTGLEKLL